MSTGISSNFKDGFIHRLRGNGSLSFREENHIVQCHSPIGLHNGAMLDWSFPVYDGDVIEFEVYGRNITGKNRVSIDFLNIDGNEIAIPFVWTEVKSKEFKHYKLRTTVPYGQGIKRARAVIGVWNNIDERSQSEFTRPKLNVQSSLNNLQTMATGLVTLDNGIYKMNKKFKHFGFESFEYDSSRKEIIVKLKNGTDDLSRPIIQATGTIDNVYIPLVGRWDSDNRTFRIAFTNGIEKQDLTTGVYYVYIEVKA